MPKIVQVPNAAAATAYLAANPNIGKCFYLVPYQVTVDGKSQRGWENQGYPNTRVYVSR
jgi:hypothetical protein